MKNFVLTTLILMCISLCVFAHEDTYKKKWKFVTPQPYSEIGIDTLQETILNYERDMSYVYGEFTERALTGMCLRAFYVWAKRYTGNDRLQLDVLELGKDFKSKHPFSGWAYEIDEDEEDSEGKFIDERELNRANLYVEQYPFKVIDAFECLGLKDIGKDTAVANTSIYPFGLFSSITVKICAFIPDSKNHDIWVKKEFWYFFRLKLKWGSDRIGVWDKNLISTLERNPYYIINRDGFVNVEHLGVDFEWQLYSIQLVQDEIIDYTNNDKPLTFKELFKDWIK